MSAPQFDPLQAFSFMLTGFGLGSAASAATLPYVAACMTAFIGAYAAAVNRDKGDDKTTINTIHFIVSRILVASVVTVSLAAIIEQWAPGFGLKWTVIPLSLLLSYIGPKEAVTKTWEWFVGMLPRGSKGSQDGR